MKIGIAVNHLGPSQLTYCLVKSAHEMLVTKPAVDITLFYENAVKPAFGLNFAAMPLVEAWTYGGTLISTNLNIAKQSIAFTGPKKKLFYVWDLEWLRFQNKEFRSLQQIYANPALTLLARSESHKQAIEQSWNIEVAATIDDFNLLKILEVLCPQ